MTGNLPGLSTTLWEMAHYLVERRIIEVSKRLRKAREELAVADEQLSALSEAADEARIRSLVSETPLAARESQEAQRHAEAMRAPETASFRRSSGWKPSSTSCSTSWSPAMPVSVRTKPAGPVSLTVSN